MLDSFMAVAGLLILLTVGAFFLNPVIALIPIFLLVALLGLKAAGAMFKHAAPSATGGTTGPAVPSTREASYDPVADPGER
jgi:predicted histidine transporter YuiF (NhaC family)